MSRRQSLSYEDFGERVRQHLHLLQITHLDISPYLLSFVHRSALNEKHFGFSESNERLEFLGDAVLELVVTAHLFRSMPTKQEGELTDLRSALVRGNHLATIAESLGLGSCIMLSKGEDLSGGAKNPYILANVFEAFIGAIYIDLGYDAAQHFIEQHVLPTLPEILEKSLHIDRKSAFQEKVQSLFSLTPTYVVLEEHGLDHQKTYTIGAMIG